MGMDVLMMLAVYGIIIFAIYKLIELFARRRERMIMLEKLDPSQIPGFDAEKLHRAVTAPKSVASVLTAGCLLAGIGLGVLFGYFIWRISVPDFGEGELFFIICTGSVLFFGGAGLVAAFVIGRKLAEKNG